MKKILLFMFVLLTTVLSACSASEDINQDLIEFDDYISYSYEKASFNNTSPRDILYGVHDYKLEFNALYNGAQNKAFITKELSDQEELSYNKFFEKLELLDKHTDAIFELDSTELKALFEANNIEVEAIDIFAFNAIKNTFDTLKDEQIRISKQDFIEIILERDLTDEEASSIEYLYHLHNEVYYERYEELELLLDVVEYIQSIENLLGRELTDTQKEDIEIAHSIITSLN